MRRRKAEKRRGRRDRNRAGTSELATNRCRNLKAAFDSSEEEKEKGSKWRNPRWSALGCDGGEKKRSNTLTAQLFHHCKDNGPLFKRTTPVNIQRLRTRRLVFPLVYSSTYFILIVQIHRRLIASLRSKPDLSAISFFQR